jgi:hypothetical protein
MYKVAIYARQCLLIVEYQILSVITNAKSLIEHINDLKDQFAIMMIKLTEMHTWIEEIANLKIDKDEANS